MDEDDDALPALIAEAIVNCGKAPPQEDLVELTEMIRRAGNATYDIRDLHKMFADNRVLYDQIIDYHSAVVSRTHCLLLLEEHDGGLFRHARFNPLKGKKPESFVMWIALKAMDMPTDPRDWASCWPEDAEDGSTAINIAHYVRPPVKELQ